ncbi:MAG: MBL fold metallo-hydrolase [Clostridia bacterium]|nr:MBL fold metallo-hydrolase [Clostridia bacterium]
MITNQAKAEKCKSTEMLKKTRVITMETGEPPCEHENSGEATNETVQTLFGNFEGHERFNFPAGIIRVTSGYGGEALLYTGGEKTALFDCGMAYCGQKTVENLTKALNGRALDYIFISHTHYDHIGAFPYIKSAFPEVKAVGAAYSKKVFSSENARKLMEALGTAARDLYSDSKEPVRTDGFCIDTVAGDGDKIDLGGDSYVEIVETPGHTNCSISFLLQPSGTFIASESTGVLEAPGSMHTAILKSFSDSIASAEKCAKISGIRHLISPHYGVIPDFYIAEYWKLFIRAAYRKKEYVLEQYKKGLDFDGILEKYVEHYWIDTQAKEQPKEAFLENAGHIIKAILKEFA